MVLRLSLCTSLSARVPFLLQTGPPFLYTIWLCGFLDLVVCQSSGHIHHMCVSWRASTSLSAVSLIRGFRPVTRRSLHLGADSCSPALNASSCSCSILSRHSSKGLCRRHSSAQGLFSGQQKHHRHAHLPAPFPILCSEGSGRGEDSGCHLGGLHVGGGMSHVPLRRGYPHLHPQ